ncbi:zinc finger protein DHHC domain-containing protein [Cordyceps javanica]|uniref:Palmitoyltransferase PFA4 n=1 Tax=Cordyceps javanica TaxID=43265 RepID=A0A545V5E3_9HYPO|nr:zinc finger protein DHHC domain-containing protein [Cordyceps javanica]TQW08188.1 zinc finger protein DHHC domain containing protein [Cordyceps javanica]
MAGIADAGIVKKVAIPGVCLLISFLGYFSQYIFRDDFLEPGAPSRTETFLFNGLLLALWYTYARTCTVDPGRYEFSDPVLEVKGRWCNKCAAPKPPRAHHCRHCRRCIPKMDHHCPWTGNCVSMTTFPHFLRFLVYANLSLLALAYLLLQRFAKLWEDRFLPSYLGPSVGTLISLSLVALVCMATSLALFIMLVTTVRSWFFNQTMIEMWEQERHEAIGARGGRDWWDIVGPDGETIRFEKVEFPYDIGFFANMAQAMGTRLFPFWLVPFAGHPRVSPPGRGSVGWAWEENGFNRKEGMWPPPDPEKIRRAARQGTVGGKRDYASELRELDQSPEERKRAFQERQEKDLRRRRRALLAELEEEQGISGTVAEEQLGEDDIDSYSDYEGDETDDWADGDGEKLADFGVDEDELDYDYTTKEVDEDENVPLGELLRRRKAQKASDDE